MACPENTKNACLSIRVESWEALHLMISAHYLSLSSPTARYCIDNSGPRFINKHQRMHVPHQMWDSEDLGGPLDI